MTHRSLPRWNGATEAAGVLVAALIVRLMFVWMMPAPPMELADQPDFDRLAHAILDGRGYVSATGLPTSERPPLYAYALASVYAVFDDGPSATRVLQGLLDAVTCLLVYLLAARHFGVQAARVSAVLAIGSLSLLFATRFLMTETISTLFMVVTVFVLDVALTRWHAILFFVTGVLVGLSTLTKGTTLLLPVALLVPIWVAARRNRRLFTRAAPLLILGFILTLLPWTIRNYRVHGEVVPVATQVGWTVYSSYAPPEGRIFGDYTHDDVVAASAALPEAERSRFLTRAAIDHIRDNPGDLPRLTALKFLYFVGPFDWHFLGVDGVFNFTYALTVLLALYGLWTVRWDGWRPVLLVTAPCFMLLQSLGLYGSARLRMPIEPLLMVLAGGGLVVAWSRAERWRGTFVVLIALTVLVSFSAYVFSADVKSASAAALSAVGLW